MKKPDIAITIAGSAGEGVQTIGSIISRSLACLGYAVFTWQEYESRIRGGLNSYSIRITAEPVNCPCDRADIIVALNSGAAEKYGSLRKPDGFILGYGSEDDRMFMPFKKLASENWGNAIFGNAVAIGSLWGILGADIKVVSKILGNVLHKKGEEVLKKNIEAVKLGYDLARKSCEDVCPWKLKQNGRSYYLINGQPAIALGAARAGCRFMAAYPMTPSTGIITYLANHEDELKIFTAQAEDEIAAINMVIGAQYAGCRAMTATSGGGFALMVEAISLSGMTETPVVIVLAQRPGPATGLPTRTLQGDLLFAINAGHGEFPKCVFAPSDPYEAFHLTVKAFNIADKFQIPVIIITDQFLADSQFSVDNFDIALSKPVFSIANPEDFDEYKRYLITDDGISPRLYPGQSHHLVAADSDEHDEAGHITEDLSNVAVPMMEKRMKKFHLLKKEIHRPTEFMISDADDIFVSWGSTRNSVHEAVRLLRKNGKRVGSIHFSEVWPLPEFSLPEPRRWIAVEQNQMAQFAGIFACEYNVEITGHILRYDGLPITAEWIWRMYNDL